MTLRRLPHAKALRVMLEAATGKPCGLGGVPRHPTGHESEGKALPPPYSVLYPIGGTVLSGAPFGDDSSDASWAYQVTCVGERPDQALWMQDRVLEAVLGRHPDDAQRFAHPLTVPGQKETRRALDVDAGPDPEGMMVGNALRFSFDVTPEDA